MQRSNSHVFFNGSRSSDHHLSGCRTSRWTVQVRSMPIRNRRQRRFASDCSQGVLIGQTLYLSGAIGLDPKTGQFIGEGVQEQTRQVDKQSQKRIFDPSFSPFSRWKIWERFSPLLVLRIKTVRRAESSFDRLLRSSSGQMQRLPSEYGRFCCDERSLFWR